MRLRLRAATVAAPLCGLAMVLAAAAGTGAAATRQVAAPLRAALAALQGVTIPIYLPASLPVPPNGEHYAVFAHGSGDLYAVTLAYAPKAEPVNASITVPASAMVGLFMGGPSQPTAVESTILASALTGKGKKVTLPNGTAATFFPREGVRWEAHGWTFTVTDADAAPAGVTALLPWVDKLQAGVKAQGAFAIAPAGETIQDIMGNDADIRLFWIDGDDGYQVWGHDVSGLTLASSLVRVAP